MIFCFVFWLLILFHTSCQLLICDISINFCDSFTYTVDWTISTCLYIFIFIFNLTCVWDECHIILCYILLYFFGVSLQIIKIFLLMKKYLFITIFFSFFFFFVPWEINSCIKKKLVLYTGYFTNSLWFLLHVEICKSSRPPLFFLRYERLYIRICTCSLILYALYCFKSFVYLWISISTFCLL